MMLQFTKIDWFNNESGENLDKNLITSCAYNEKLRTNLTQFELKDWQKDAMERIRYTFIN